MSNVAVDADDAKADRDPSATMSVIGADIVVTGNIEATVDLNIEGKVVGDVQCATLILGAQSVVEGNIRAERVRVSGCVKGSIETRDLAIEASAVVTGDIAYDRLRIASGGALEGSLRRVAAADTSSEAARLKLVQPVDQAKGDQPPIYIE